MKPRVGDVVAVSRFLYAIGGDDKGTLGTVIKEESFPNFGWVMLSTGEIVRFADDSVRLIVQKEQETSS